MVATLDAHPVARAEDATDLLFFSGDLMTARSYGGVGWLHAASGLEVVSRLVV